MKGFSEKPIETERTLAEILADGRLRKGVSIEEASHALHIQPHHLHAFEDGHLDALPGEVYAKKYLERYARYLEVPYPSLRGKLEESLREVRWAHTPREGKLRKEHFAVWPNAFRRIAVIGAILAIIGYFGAALITRLTPPPLAVDYPPNGLVTHVEELAVSGKTEPEARLTVNGATTPVGADGHFSISLKLQEGINYIHLTAARRAGRQREVEVRVVRQQPLIVD